MGGILIFVLIGIIFIADCILNAYDEEEKQKRDKEFDEDWWRR